jgi:hypothetical protein
VTTSGPGLSARTSRFSVLAVAVVALVAVASGSARATAGPTLVSEPTISGAAVLGETLQGNRGIWQSSKEIAYGYQWLQCRSEPVDDSSSKTCRTIADATKATYDIRSDDLGKRIRLRVTAKNSTGSTTATSAATSVVAQPGDKPASTYPPVITGSTIVGETLKTSTGKWTGDQPITYSYRWLRCDKEGNACKAIDRATQASYKLKQADVGKTLRTRVIAKNSRGQGDAYSPATTIVQDSSSGGIITLPDGTKSVDVKDIPNGQRLIVDKVVFSPNPLTSTAQPFLAQVRVKDTRNYVVRGAIVFIRTTPRVANGGDNSPTNTEGWVQYSLPPTADMQKLTSFQNLQLFVKAYRKGDPGLAGISGTRLVQVGLSF